MMENKLSRRDWMRYLGVSGIVAGVIGAEGARGRVWGNRVGFRVR